MYKLFRFFSTLANGFRKPIHIHGAEKRLALSNIVQQVWGEEKHEEAYKQNLAAMMHKAYINKLTIQIKEKQLQQKYLKNNGGGLTEMIQPKNLMNLGDYKNANPEHFVHTMQFGREGADLHFWQLSDEKTIVSEFFENNNEDFQLEYSLLIN